MNITERVGKSFVKLSVDSAFLFLGVRSKTKMWNWQKVFYNMFNHKLDLCNFKQSKQRSSKGAYVHITAL